ncbi:hypothetical protein LUZ60_010849 [Juncus effusus]|nr:hypothetical protein LUZ60_010849 [Juncus effusus]
MDSSIQTLQQNQSSSEDRVSAGITADGDGGDRDHDETIEKKKAPFPSLGTVMLIMVTSWALFCASGQPFLTFASKVMLLLLTILFLWSKSARALNRPLPPIPKMNISEETINQAAIIIGAFCNKILSGFETIALGKDSRLFYIVALSLWLTSIFGNYTHFINFSCIKSLFST